MRSNRDVVGALRVNEGKCSAVSIVDLYRRQQQYFNSIYFLQRLSSCIQLVIIRYLSPVAVIKHCVPLVLGEIS